MKKNDVKLAHILLVEDNEGDVLLTKDAFAECKIRTDISVARNGQEALDFLFKRGEFKAAQTPDLILLDINIPIFNGHEVLAKIKANRELKKITVIILTTSSHEKDKDKAYNKHCNSYVLKPLNIADFIEAIIKIEQFWLQLSSLPK